MVGKMMRWEIKGLDALILPLTVALKIVVEGEEASEAVEMRKHTSPLSWLWHTCTLSESTHN